MNIQRPFPFAGFLVGAFLVLQTMSTASAQPNEHVGFRGGIAFADLYGDEPIQNTSLRTGLHLGGYGAARLSRNTALQMELNFIQKGTSYESSDGVFRDDVNLRLQYIQLPVLLRLGNPDRYDGGLYFLAGPYAAFLVNQVFVNEENEEEDASDLYKSFDAGLMGTIGLDLGSNVFAELRYEHGLVDIVEEDQYLNVLNFQAQEDYQRYNQSFSLTFGFMLR